MRQLIEQRILEVTEGDDEALAGLEFAPATTHANIPNLSDVELLNLYEALIGFNG